jgi:hypothetical protein
MPPAQQPLRLVESHIHPFGETCPTCEQPIPNEKAKEIRARATAMEKRLAAEAEARAAQKLATEKAQIEEAAKARIEQAEREKADAVKKANAEAAAKIEAAKAEGQKLAEAAAAQKVAAAEKAKADAEKAKAEADAAAAQKVAAAEQAAKARQEEAEKQLEAANTEKAQALAKIKQVEAERDAAIETRVREVREAMEKDKADALAKKDSDNDEKTRKLLVQVQTLERKLEEKRADQLGEGAHIQLLDALKAEFPEDSIRRISPGVSGADILHTVMRNGVSCGSILYESKNSMQWRDDYVTKLVRDQTAAEADHAVLSTFKFPKDTDQVETREGVIIVKPTRAVAIAQILRKHLLHVHTLRLSKSERAEKTAALYDFMTSERYALLNGRVDTDSDALLTLQDADKKYHDKHWQKEGLLIRSIQKVKGEIDTAVELIIGGSRETELTE